MVKRLLVSALASSVVVTSSLARADETPRVSAPLVCIALHGHTKTPMPPAFSPLGRQPTWTDARPQPVGFRTLTLPIVRATF
ncbi:MAG TPA: hypothetical protein VGH87_17410 [Polyangiaceae bacterium]